MAHASKKANQANQPTGRKLLAEAESPVGTRKSVRVKSDRQKPKDLLEPAPPMEAPTSKGPPVFSARADSESRKNALHPAVPSTSESGNSFLLDAAMHNNHEAQYELAKRLAHGSKGATRSTKQSDYWLSRAAAGQHQKAIDSILKRSDEEFTVGKEMKRPLLNAEACADHAAFKVGKSKSATEIFEKSILINGLDRIRKDELIQRLFAVPENRPYLEMAACMMKNGQINHIRIGPLGTADGNRTGSFNSWLGRVSVRLQDDAGMDRVAETLMHELTHALMFELHRNNVKSYSSPKQKQDLKLALMASREGEARALTPLERKVAAYMNSPFTTPGYDNNRSYKIEREVRIGAWLAADYAARNVFQNDYPHEWRRYIDQGELCRTYVAQCANKGCGIDSTPVSTIPPCSQPGTKPASPQLAAAAFDRAVAEVFGDVRKRIPGTAILQARAALEDALSSANVEKMDFTLDQLSTLCDELARIYLPRFEGKSSDRRFVALEIDENGLEKLVKSLINRVAAQGGKSDSARKKDDISSDEWIASSDNSTEFTSEYSSESASDSGSESSICQPVKAASKPGSSQTATTIQDAEESSS
jgi:hypothetical protein